MSLTNKIPPQPLPLCPEGFPAGSRSQRAFQACKTLESQKQWFLSTSELALAKSHDIMYDLSPTCAGRVLGFGLLYSPSESGRENLATEILGCNDDDEQLAGLAHLYVYGFIGIFYNPEAAAQTISTEQSPEASVENTGLEYLLGKPSLTASDLKILLMAREEGICPCTGRTDISSFTGISLADRLEVAHIISRSLSEGTKGGKEEFNWAKTAGAIIEHFGGFPSQSLLGSENINNPRNTMMLAPFAQKLFNDLDLWLTPFQDRGNVVPNTYNVNLAKVALFGNFKHTATLPAHPLPKGGVIEPPSRQILALHATCAQIAHLSGAVEHLVETFRDTESIPVLTAAPNSANELVHALKKVQLQQSNRPMHV